MADESKTTKIDRDPKDDFLVHERDGKWLVTYPWIDYWIVCPTKELAETIHEAFEEIKEAASYGYAE
jgi:predicted RNase H-like HicB family nuclease